jgi:Zn-dependent membrane protease YugP
MGLNPLYFLVVGPGILLALWAQFKVKQAFAMGQEVQANCGWSGAQVAQKILEAFNLEGKVGIEITQGFLGDHYDPANKMLRLSPDVYNGTDLSALGVAAHEVGHAIQHAEGYAPLKLRNAIVPMASIGSNLSYFLILIGMMISSMGLIMLGIILFSIVVFFQIVNLPVEFDASSRARAILTTKGIISHREEETVAKVLNAAAWTYVAATVTSVLTLLYYLMMARDGDSR